MFKPGDKVIVVDNKGMESSFNIGDEFIVNRYELHCDHYSITIKKDYHLFYNTKFFMTQNQIRKQKIKQICLNQEKK